MPSTANRLDTVKRAKALGLLLIEDGEDHRDRLAQRRWSIASRIAHLDDPELGRVEALLDRLGR